MNNAYRPLILQVQFQRTISISQYHSNTIACLTFDELNHYGGKSTTNPDASMETCDAVGVAQVQGSAVRELAKSVKELSFAFRREASPLLEMCWKTWWEEKGAIPSIVVKQ